MTTTVLGIPEIASTDLVQNGPTQIDAALNFIDALLPHLVTTLPGSPLDGQLIDYVADATNGVVWRFRYRAASSSAHKWEFAGGSDLGAPSQGIGLITTNATADVALTGGPTVAAPFAGDYEVFSVTNMFANTCSSPFTMFVSIGLNGVSTGVALNEISAPVIFAGGYHVGRGEVSIPAGGVVSIMVHNSSAESATYNAGKLWIRPVRIG
jgi:hypothetical protein